MKRGVPGTSYCRSGYCRVDIVLKKLKFYIIYVGDFFTSAAHFVMSIFSKIISCHFDMVCFICL